MVNGYLIALKNQLSSSSMKEPNEGFVLKPTIS
jgi:hypothetical protein